MPANDGKIDHATFGEAPRLSSHGAADYTVDQSATDQERAQLLSRQLGPPAQVEGYRIERCLGAGAFGTVWLATQISTGKQVAIKFYEHRGGLDWTLLNREVEKLAFLYTERDIVRLIDVGWDATPPYYVMEYLERGSLDQLLQHKPLPVDEAVRIVRDVAQALVHAHGRGILHCDLKPANVLLDHDWKVRLADFGQSRLSYEQRPALGTLFYMAPEQADLAATPDARWDVYALGALLYHCLTGTPPHRSEVLEERLRSASNLTQRLELYRQAINASPRLAAHRVRGVDRALAEIVDRCLEPDPSRRYANAQAVLDALDRRTRMRARRPLIALGVVAPLLLLVGTVVQGVFSWRDAVRQSEQSLISAVQAGNVYAANGVANTVLLHLHKLSHEVEHISDSTEIRRLMSDQDRSGLQTFVERVHADHDGQRSRLVRNGHSDAFESWLVMDPDGTILARSPSSPVIGRNYAWRDYFQSAIALRDKPGETVYVSRVFVSESDQLYKFAISALVRENDAYDAPVLGVLVATVTTGILPLKDERRTAVLVGRWDTNRRPGEEAAAQPDYLILLHPARKKDDPAAEPVSPVIDRIEQSRQAGRPLSREDATDDDYADPFGSGRWLAGFASVGNTEFVVIVQQRYAEAIAPVNSLATTLAWRGWTALCFGGILLAAMWYYVQQAMNRSDRIGAAAQHRDGA